MMQILLATALLLILGPLRLVRASALLKTRQAFPPFNASALRRVIEVDPPVRFVVGEDDAAAEPVFQATLARYVFGNSYERPYVGPYIPPPREFNRASLNLTVTSSGRQFDRLGTVSLGDVEIFRTSTAEPTINGIVWTYIKDISPFVSLLKRPTKVIFDLGNLIDDIYTGPFNVTLTASYYQVDDPDAEPAADYIIPISKRLDNASSVFNTARDNITSTLITLPKHVDRAVVSIAANGQLLEEFWPINLLEQDVNAFPSAGTLPGLSPFREVQLYIDGKLAGVVFPFPVIFTGGVVPSLWRPVVGIDAFDLREDEIDITPWLPYLSDGKAHNFTLAVTGLAPGPKGTTELAGRADLYWVLSGKIFLFNGRTPPYAGSSPEVSGPSHGDLPTLKIPPPTISTSSKLVPVRGSNDSTLSYSVSVSRSLSVTRGKTTWRQSLSLVATGVYSDFGNRQDNTFLITGHDRSSSGYERFISYPLNVSSLYVEFPDGFQLDATISRGKTVRSLGPSIFPNGLAAFETPSETIGSLLSTSQQGVANLVSNNATNTTKGSGDTRQQLRLSAVRDAEDPGQPLYTRNLEARNGTIVADDEVDVGRPVPDSGPGHGRSGSALASGQYYAFRAAGIQNRFGQSVGPNRPSRGGKKVAHGRGAR